MGSHSENRRASAHVTPEQEDQPSHDTQSQSSEAGAPPSYYSPLVAYGFSVNYIVGVGVLSVPFAFYAAGIPVSLVSLFIASIVELLALMWILEASARAKLLGAQDGLTFLDWEKKHKNDTATDKVVSHTSLPSGKLRDALFVSTITLSPFFLSFFFFPL